MEKFRAEYAEAISGFSVVSLAVLRAHDLDGPHETKTTFVATTQLGK
ncbi:MAG TPA: hypothetical protein VFP67_06430 [Acidimicrobiia bacterium]|nr:hypothetical protein [Acidimicrobiia bacterium]